MVKAPFMLFQTAISRVELYSKPALAMAITDLFKDSLSNRHDGVYLAYHFLGTSLHYFTSGKLKRLRKAKHVAKT